MAGPRHLAATGSTWKWPASTAVGYLAQVMHYQSQRFLAMAFGPGQHEPEEVQHWIVMEESFAHTSAVRKDSRLIENPRLIFCHGCGDGTFEGGSQYFALLGHCHARPCIPEFGMELLSLLPVTLQPAQIAHVDLLSTQSSSSSRI